MRRYRYPIRNRRLAYPSLQGYWPGSGETEDPTHGDGGHEPDEEGEEEEIKRSKVYYIIKRRFRIPFCFSSLSQPLFAWDK